MSMQRTGLVFLLPKHNKKTQSELRDYVNQMNNKFSKLMDYFGRLTDYCIDQLHADGYGDYSPRLSYSFSVKHVASIADFMCELNATSESRVVRILVTDKQDQETDAIKVPQASHLAIMVFVSSDNADFVATTTHPNPPLFYQKVRSVEEAVIMSNAVSIDSIMCHAVGLCDDSFNFDAKKELSRDKVTFLRSDYLKENAPSWFNNSELLHEIDKIRRSVNETTPYISLLSPFIKMIKDKVSPAEIARMYAMLWERFVIWYVQDHKRYIRIGTTDSRHFYHALQTVKNYSGQIYFETFAAKIKEVLTTGGFSDGMEQQVFLIILRHLPTSKRSRQKLETLFGEEQESLHQGSWNVVTSERIKNHGGDNNIVVHNMFISSFKEDSDER